MINQSQIDAFHRDGFLLLRGMFIVDEIEMLRLAAQPIIHEGMSFQGTGHNYHYNADGTRMYWGTAPVHGRRLMRSLQACVFQPHCLAAS
jgi:hypothetical protein